MRRALLAAFLLACTSETKPAPKAADNTAAIRETQSLPTSSAAEPVPAVTGTVAPKPTPVVTAAPSTSASAAPKKGALTKAECTKMVRKFAENVAMDKNAELKEGFEQIPMFQTMVDECVANSTRAQYDCVMASKTMQDWLGCMR